MLINYFITGHISALFMLPAFFVLEILIINTVILRKCEKRDNFWLRTVVAYVGAVVMGLFFPNSLFLPVDFVINITLTYVLLFAVSVLLSWIPYKIGFTQLLFISAISFSSQNIINNLVRIGETIVNTAFPKIAFGVEVFIYYASVAVFGFLVCFLLYKLFMRRTKGDILIKLSKIQTFAFVVITIFTANFLHAYLGFYDFDFGHRIAILLTISLLDGIIAYLQMTVLMSDKISKELDNIRILWAKEQKSFTYNSEKLNEINKEMHDMKHLLLYGNEVEQKAAKTGIEKIVSGYESILYTGNTALDVVLNEKSSICRNRNIEFSVIADGNALQYMNSVDVYILFGNMLDNAIESACKLEQKDRRIITLLIQAENDCVKIRSDNYFNYKIDFENGMPRTTKTNKDAHGFGTKSIGLITRKYDGTSLFFVNDDIFTVEITLPLKQPQAS